MLQLPGPICQHVHMDSTMLHVHAGSPHAHAAISATPPLLCRHNAEKEGKDAAVVLDVARDGREAGQLRLTLAPNQRCVFGRHPGSCDVVLEHLSISRQHANLSMDLNSRCFITDMGSGKRAMLNLACIAKGKQGCLWPMQAAYD